MTFFTLIRTLTSKIKVRIIGGKGKDTFNINGHVPNYIYDYKPETNYFVHTSRTKNLTSSDVAVNDYSVTELQIQHHPFSKIKYGL